MGFSVGFGLVGFAVTGDLVGRPVVGEGESLGLTGALEGGDAAALVGDGTGLVGRDIAFFVGDAVGSAGTAWDGDAISNR